MKFILPRRFELALFIAMALVAGILAAISTERDTMLFLLTVPIFFVGAMLGYRRSLIVVPVTTDSKQEAIVDGK